MRVASLAALGLLASGVAQAQIQSSAANNQAYINQLTAATSSPSILNSTIFTQSGTGNRLGSVADLFVQSALADGVSNVFVSTQTTDDNLIGYLVGGAGTMPLIQSGRANVAAITQQGRNGNVLGGMVQENTAVGGNGNALTLIQDGHANYVLEIAQRNNGRDQNLADIRQTGDFNGYPAGYVFGDGRTGAINGTIALMRRAYIGTADAPLSLFFAANSVSAYGGPGDRAGAVLEQRGGKNLAVIDTAGTDNSFLVQQNSSTTQNGKGSSFGFTASGSSDYAYALQVGTNTATDIVVGSQNAMLVYQAGYSGAGSDGYGNVVAWRQGEGAADIQNFAEAVQLGFNNTIMGSQTGHDNVFRSDQQGAGSTITASAAGIGNLADIQQAGARNTAGVTQNGNANAAIVTQR